MVAPLRVPHRCVKVLSIVRAYPNDANEKANRAHLFINSDAQIRNHNPKGLRIPARWQVEWEKFVSISRFHVSWLPVNWFHRHRQNEE